MNDINKAFKQNTRKPYESLSQEISEMLEEKSSLNKLAEEFAANQFPPTSLSAAARITEQYRGLYEAKSIPKRAFEMLEEKSSLNKLAEEFVANQFPPTSLSTAARITDQHRGLHDLQGLTQVTSKILIELTPLSSGSPTVLEASKLSPTILTALASDVARINNLGSESMALNSLIAISEKIATHVSKYDYWEKYTANIECTQKHLNNGLSLLSMNKVEQEAFFKNIERELYCTDSTDELSPEVLLKYLLYRLILILKKSKKKITENSAAIGLVITIVGTLYMAYDQGKHHLRVENEQMRHNHRVEGEQKRHNQSIENEQRRHNRRIEENLEKILPNSTISPPKYDHKNSPFNFEV